MGQKYIEQNEAFEVQQKLVSSLQQQIKFYEKKFNEVQVMLTKSHDTCTSLANQHDKMKKRLANVQTERVNLQQKLEVKSKQASQAIKQNEKTATKQGKLEKLCRALQQERSQLNKQLRLLESQLSTSNCSTPPPTESINKSKVESSAEKPDQPEKPESKDEESEKKVIDDKIEDAVVQVETPNVELEPDGVTTTVEGATTLGQDVTTTVEGAITPAVDEKVSSEADE